MKLQKLPGYWLARGFWRLADLLDHVPGFTEGFERAYDLYLERETRHEQATPE